MNVTITNEETKSRDLAKRSLLCQSDENIANNEDVNDSTSSLAISEI